MLTRIATAVTLCAAVGCSAAGDPGDSQGPNNPNNPNNPEQALQISGDYTVTSEFALTPADLGSGGDFAIDLQDLADDPIDYIAGLLADEVGLSILKGQIEGMLEDAMGEDAQRLADAVSEFLNASLDFDVVSQLSIDGSGRDLTMTHFPTGMSVVINNKTYEYDFADLKSDNLQSYAITATGSTLDLSSHSLEIPYAQMLLTVLDDAIIPALDADADNLGEALLGVIDCAAIGAQIQPTLDDILPFTVNGTALCETGVQSLANEIISRIGGLDSLTFDVTLDGKATAMDDNADHKADRIEGKWDSAFFGLDSGDDTPFKALRAN